MTPQELLDFLGDMQPDEIAEWLLKEELYGNHSAFHCPLAEALHRFTEQNIAVRRHSITTENYDYETHMHEVIKLPTNVETFIMAFDIYFAYPELELT